MWYQSRILWFEFCLWVWMLQNRFKWHLECWHDQRLSLPHKSFKHWKMKLVREKPIQKWKCLKLEKMGEPPQYQKKISLKLLCLWKVWSKSYKVNEEKGKKVHHQLKLQKVKEQEVVVTLLTLQIPLILLSLLIIISMIIKRKILILLENPY